MIYFNPESLCKHFRTSLTLKWSGTFVFGKSDSWFVSSVACQDGEHFRMTFLSVYFAQLLA